MNRFEHLVHTDVASEGELSVERFGELWAESQDELFGDSVELTDGYRTWWSYIPHFIGSPGYVYAYAYGQLLALSVYERYEQPGRRAGAALSGAAGGRRLAQPRGARARSSASISPTRASGRRVWIWSSASCTRPKSPPRRRGGCSDGPLQPARQPLGSFTVRLIDLKPLSYSTRSLLEPFGRVPASRLIVFGPAPISIVL